MQEGATVHLARRFRNDVGLAHHIPYDGKLAEEVASPAHSVNSYKLETLIQTPMEFKYIDKSR